MTLPLNSNDKILKNYKRFRESCDLNLHLAQIDVHISVTCVGGFSTLLKIWIVLMLPLLLLYIAQKSSLCHMFQNPNFICSWLGKFHIWFTRQNPNFFTPTPQKCPLNTKNAIKKEPHGSLFYPVICIWAQFICVRLRLLKNLQKL